MTNGERVARDLGFLVGQYERGEIKAATLCRKAEELTRASCGHCIAKDVDAIFCHSTCTCDEGFHRWLLAEVET